MTKDYEIKFGDGKELTGWPVIHVTMMPTDSRQGQNKYY